MSDPTDSTPRSIALRGKRSLSTVRNSLISRGLQDLQAIHKATVLRFPPECSLGCIIQGESDDIENRLIALAKGDVVVNRVSELKPYLMLDEGARSRLRALRQLESNSLWGLEMAWDRHTDDDLENVSHLTGLRELVVVGSDELTDEGLQCLHRMVLLTTLDIVSDEVTDNGVLRLLRCLPGLSSLVLCCSRLTDAFFEGLVDLPMSRKLTQLKFNCSFVSSRGLALIGQLSELRSLSLSDVAGLDDTALSRILSSTQLEDLCVYDCSISDASVEPLSKALSLRKLVAHRVFSSDAIGKLKMALPNCKINATPKG